MPSGWRVHTPSALTSGLRLHCFSRVPAAACMLEEGGTDFLYLDMCSCRDLSSPAAGGGPARIQGVHAIVDAGVAVMGHTGLMPQVGLKGFSTHAAGGEPHAVCPHPRVPSPLLLQAMSWEIALSGRQCSHEQTACQIVRLAR